MNPKRRKLSGQLFANDFELLRPLGEGGMGDFSGFGGGAGGNFGGGFGGGAGDITPPVAEQ